jgi:mannose/fructose/N-acetylgalactosamine-specific phosphotransferase system component IID
MEWYWIVFFVAVFVLWTVYIYWKGFKYGYKKGGMLVLNAWKETVDNAEEEIKNANFPKNPFMRP